MASQLYPNARELFGTAQLNWTAGVMKAVLLPEAYNPDFDDTALADISSGARIAVSDAITGRTILKGKATSDPIHFGILVDPRRAAKMVIYKHIDGDEPNSLLVAFLDSESLLGTPLDLVGFDYFYVPSSLEGGIFRL